MAIGSPSECFGFAASCATAKINERQTRIASFPSAGNLFPVVQSFSSTFETTERLRAGVFLPVSPGLTIMPYVTGGVTFTQINVSDSMYFPTSFNSGSSTQFRAGWTAGLGVGLETALGCRVQLQWLHEDFGSIAYIAPNPAFAASTILTGHRFTQERVTIGLNVPIERIGAAFGGR